MKTLDDVPIPDATKKLVLMDAASKGYASVVVYDYVYTENYLGALCDVWTVSTPDHKFQSKVYIAKTG